MTAGIHAGNDMNCNADWKSADVNADWKSALIFLAAETQSR